MKTTMNVADLLAVRAERHPAKTALVYHSQEFSFRDLDEHTSRVASGLRSLGVSSGDRVAIAMHNVPHFVFAYFGILRAGGVAVPVNAMLTRPEAERVLGDCRARVVVGAPPFGEIARNAARSVDSVEHIVLTDGWDEAFPPSERVRAPEDEDALAVLAYTSGTTGEPKGAMLTHGNLLAALRQQMRVPEHATEDDVLLLVLPLFHIFGLNVALGSLAYAGATGVLIDRFEPIETLRLIERYSVTMLFGAPTMYSAWLNTPGGDGYDLSSVRIAVSGAAPLAPEVLRGFKDVFGIDIYEGYGLTETAPTVTSNRMADRPKAGSIGKELPGVEIRLVDENGHDVELGDPGEIVVRGPNVFQGYWQRDEETKKAFLGEWFRTGDIAVRDEDGYYYLVDRKRDLIIVSGFNVFPSEVENALLQNPKVADAAVVGVAHPYSGEAVKAYVVLEPGTRADEAELLADTRTRLARFKCPDAIEIVDDLPHLLTGKVLRRALRT